jgi:hypothetical protein
MGEKEEKPIRVVDRRMFTPDGELRPDFEAEEPEVTARALPLEPERLPPPAPAPARPPAPAPSASSAAASVRDAMPAQEDVPGEPSEPRGEFTAIVRSLATTAYSALGLLPDPAGARHREPAVARQMIDWLTVLESKTRNNLSFEETDFLSRVLYELRLAYVEVTRPPGR